MQSLFQHRSSLLLVLVNKSNNKQSISCLLSNNKILNQQRFYFISTLKNTTNSFISVNHNNIARQIIVKQQLFQSSYSTTTTDNNDHHHNNNNNDDHPPPIILSLDQFPKKILEKYTPTAVLGTGAFGEVYRAEIKPGVTYPPSLLERDTVAIKVMSKKKNPYAHLECELLSSVNHPNVLKFIEEIDTPDNVYLITEELRGPELFQVLIDRDEPFDEETSLMFGEQMLRAIEACHKKNFAHIDVKVENMVFREPDLNSPLVLVDFGAAQQFVRAPYADKSNHYIEGLDDDTRELSERPAGTAPYLSPEVINGFFSSRSDVWSVGVSLFVLLTGRRPFDSVRKGIEAEKSVVRQIRHHGGSRTRPAIDLPLPPDMASPEVIDFLHNLTRGHPADRVSATEALADLALLRKQLKDHKKRLNNQNNSTTNTTSSSNNTTTTTATTNNNIGFNKDKKVTSLLASSSTSDTNLVITNTNTRHIV
jgi:serine/threonine protein kinase